MGHIPSFFSPHSFQLRLNKFLNDHFQTSHGSDPVAGFIKTGSLQVNNSPPQITVVQKPAIIQ